MWNHKETFEKDGIAVIPSIFTKDEMDRLRGAALVALTTNDNWKYPHRYIEYKKRDGENAFPALIFWPALVNEYIDEIHKDPRLQMIVKAFLGDNVKQLNNQIYFRFPGDGDEFAWHQDVCFREPRSRYPGIEGAYLQTAIVIDDMTLENSPIEFIPGSHLKGEWELDSVDGVTKMLREFRRGGLEGKKYTAKSGDVIVWSVLTVHGSEANQSSRSRMYYMNGFARADAALDWPYYLKDGVVQDIDYTKIP